MTSKQRNTARKHRRRQNRLRVIRANEKKPRKGKGHRPLKFPKDRSKLIEAACAAEDGSISAGSPELRERGFSEESIKTIERGLADAKAGRVHDHADVKKEILGE